MERPEALKLISTLLGKDLRPMAEDYDITVWKDGKKNKGWAGHVIERFLGLPLNSSRAPNFGTWELKVVPVVPDPDGKARVKETMAITMLDPIEVASKTFEQSHLYLKLRKQIVVARTFVDQDESSSLVFSVTEFDLKDPALYEAVKQDYEAIRNTVRTRGFAALSGKLGVCIQPRIKGPGHGSTSRAFYARTGLVAHICGIKDLDLSAYK